MPVRTPSNSRDVRKQIIWYNKDICTDRKTFVYKRLDEHGIKFVDDITDRQSYLFRYDCFLIRDQDVRIGQLRYMSLCSAIPTEWKELLIGSEPLSTDEKSKRPYVEIKRKEMPFKFSCFFNSTWIESELNERK